MARRTFTLLDSIHLVATVSVGSCFASILINGRGLRPPSGPVLNILRTGSWASTMSATSVRDLTATEEAAVEDVLRRLREHFREWPCVEGGEHDLVGFAYYEGCGGTECCGQILIEAAPLALGKELATKHGFRWVMIRSKRTWGYGVVHPGLGQPIDLNSLEGGSWNEEEYDQPPCPGRMTHDSLETIVGRVR